MNYDEFNLVGDYIKENVVPFIEQKSGKILVSIQDYLFGIENWEYKVSEYHMTFTPAYYEVQNYLKKFQDRCVGFYHPEDGQRDGIMLFFHQVKPNIHLISSLGVGVKSAKAFGYIRPRVYYKNWNDYLTICEMIEPLKLTGNLDEEPKGFFGK